MTNDQRLDGFHNYRFEMYCADQAEITSLRTQLAEVARERDLLRAALIDCAVPLEVLHAIDCELAPATQAGITAAIAAIRSALFSAQPEPKPLTPADRVMIALAGRDKDDAERTLDKMYPKPEPKPEAPKPHPITRDDLTKAGPG